MKIANLAIVVRMIVIRMIFAVICADAYNTCNDDDVHSAWWLCSLLTSEGGAMTCADELHCACAEGGQATNADHRGKKKRTRTAAVRVMSGLSLWCMGRVTLGSGPPLQWVCLPHTKTHNKKNKNKKKICKEQAMKERTKGNIFKKVAGHEDKSRSKKK